MPDLTHIFAPIAGGNPNLTSIDVVAFDIFGTLIDHAGVAKDRTLNFAHYLRQSGKVDVAFVSTQPEKAMTALMRAGCQLIAVGDGVQLKSTFYESCANRGLVVLTIDDEAQAAERAAVHIDPNDPKTKRYFDTKGYRHPQLFV